MVGVLLDSWSAAQGGTTGDKKMNMQQIMKMAIEAYCEITGSEFNFVANECATNFEGSVSQAVLMIAVMFK